ASPRPGRGACTAGRRRWCCTWGVVGQRTGTAGGSIGSSHLSLLTNRGEMRRQELSGSVQRRDRYVKDRVIGLEDVGHPRGDVERDLDVGGGGLSREADGVVEENLVSSGLDDQGRQAGQVGEDGADEANNGVLSRRVVGDSGLEEVPAEERIDLAPGFRGRPGQGEIG